MPRRVGKNQIKLLGVAHATIVLPSPRAFRKVYTLGVCYEVFGVMSQGGGLWPSREPEAPCREQASTTTLDAARGSPGEAVEITPGHRARGRRGKNVSNNKVAAGGGNCASTSGGMTRVVLVTYESTWGWRCCYPGEGAWGAWDGC